MHSSRMRTVRSSSHLGGSPPGTPSVMVFWCGALWRGGLLLWPSGMVAFWCAFWCGGLLVWCLLLWPSPPEDHARRPPSIRRPPNQKAITEGHNRMPYPLGPSTPRTRHPPQERAPHRWRETPLLQGMLGYLLHGMLG